MNNTLRQWLEFDEMITPKIIKVIYWIFLVITIVGGVTGMFANFFAGCIGLVFGVIGLRVGCEMVILMFNIYKQLKKLQMQFLKKQVMCLRLKCLHLQIIISDITAQASVNRPFL